MTYTSGQLFAYGLFGLPLALLALPVYVMVPQLYAAGLGLSLATVGAVLLGARVLDAFIDPMLGRWIDRAQPGRGHAGFVLLSLPLLLAGFVALFHPPAVGEGALAAWFGASLMLVYLGYSLATIAHNSWGASLTQQRGERARLTATREGCALAGVVLAAVLPAYASQSVLTASFAAMLLAAAALLWKVAPRARAAVLQPGAGASGSAASFDDRWLAPLSGRRFRWLFAVFAVNGIAAAIPATLFLFFATDQLQLAQHAPLFLLLYFGAGALALPLWSRLAQRTGEARAWLAGMALAVLAFGWTVALGPGDLLPFALACLLSGAALGADLALPPALLAGLIARREEPLPAGGSFGVWTFVTKLNLALAAGVALPALALLGYRPGEQGDEARAALTAVYALLPLLLKAAALCLLWAGTRRLEPDLQGASS